MSSEGCDEYIRTMRKRESERDKETKREGKIRERERKRERERARVGSLLQLHSIEHVPKDPLSSLT
jgi:hypothetical protein